jgi:hypothetical protein
MIKKRINLYNKFRDNAPNITNFDAKYPDFTTWDSTFFNNDNSVKSIWNKSLKFVDKTTNKKLWGSDLSDFYSTFVCSDKSWAKKTQYCKTSSSGGSTGGGNSSSDENSVSNGIYTTKGDPYQYKVVGCVWYTKGKKITDWTPLEGNQNATNILDGRFPGARKECKKTETSTTTSESTNLPEWAGCLKLLANVKISKDSQNQEIVTAPFGKDITYYWNNMLFLYSYKDGNTLYGKWSCKDNVLTIKLDRGDIWTSTSGWNSSSSNTETSKQNVGTTWTNADDFLETDSAPSVETNTGNVNGTTSPQNGGDNADDIIESKSTMDNLENILNEVNSLIIEQTQQVVQAPKDELNILETNALLKSKGTLETLCRTNNGTSKPVNINNKIYFAGKLVTKKDTKTPAYITYDGRLIERVGNSCNFKYIVGEDGSPRQLNGIAYSDLTQQQTNILSKWGINLLDYNSDPYYWVKTMTAKIQDLITNNKARSMAFKSWNDMLSYFDPRGVRLTGEETSFTNPMNDELNNFRTRNSDFLGLQYMGKPVYIYIPKTQAMTAGTKKVTYDAASCQLELKTYLTAAFEFKMNGDSDPNINNSVVREHLRGCYSHGKFDNFAGFTKDDLDIDFSKENSPFKWWREGTTLSMKNIKELLTGDNKNLPLVSGGRKNPYLNFNIDTMRESNVKLNNLIKENLQQLSEQKSNNLLAETKIIQTRTKILTENRILKFKQPREKFFNEIISESLYLESQGFDKQLIKEEFWDTLKGMFGQHGSEAIFGTFKEYMGKWLLQKLTPVNPDGWIGSIVVASIGNLHIDDLSKLTDCNFLTKKLASSIGEGIARKIQHDKGYDGGISDIVRNGLFSAIDNTEMVKSLESGLAKLICPGLSNISQKLGDKAQEMKTKAVQP